MYRRNGAILYSASDVAGFLECPHLTSLDRTHLGTPLQKATAGFPGPLEAESLPVPSEQCVGLEVRQRPKTARPEAVEPDPRRCARADEDGGGYGRRA